MTKLFAIAAILAAFVSPAIADPEIPLPLPRPNPTATIPAEYRGEWCERNSTYFLRRSIEQCARGSEAFIEITAKTYSAWETECLIFNIRRDEMGHTITFDCQFEEDREITTLWFVTTPGSGSQGYKITRLYIESEKWR